MKYDGHKEAACQKLDRRIDKCEGWNSDVNLESPNLIPSEDAAFCGLAVERIKTRETCGNVHCIGNALR